MINEVLINGASCVMMCPMEELCGNILGVTLFVHLRFFEGEAFIMT